MTVTAAVRIAGAFVVAVVVGAFALAVGPALVGGPRPIVIESGSMAPALRVGDVVLVSRAARPVTPGDIVTFEDRERGGLVTHRVIDRRGRGVVTQGDANPTPDVAAVRPDDVVGVVTLRIPFAGWPVLWVAEDRWGWVAVGAAAVALATEAVRSPRSPRHRRRPAPRRRGGEAAVGVRP